jgi:chromate transporter
MDEREASLSDIARAFLKIGAVSYGGPAIVGIMQTELQEKRQWLAKQRFVDGLALVNMLPGPLATQLGIYIGHAKQGITGGIVAGLGFIVPAFLVMLALSWIYATFGSFAVARDSLYGIGPVVVGIFAVSVYRLAKGTIRNRLQVLICVGTMALMLLTSIGLWITLLAAGCFGIALFSSWRIGLTALIVLLLVAALSFVAADVWPTLDTGRGIATATGKPTLWELAVSFLKVGAFTFGGGLSMLAFIQDQVVAEFGWLTPREFIDGLALGQFTPGPVLMLAAFVGFKIAGATGAAVAAGAIFFPSFVMILSILPVLQRMQGLAWLQAFMCGIGPAVIGLLVVALLRMVPTAAPDYFTAALLVLTVAILMLRSVGPFPLVLGGAVIGVLLRTLHWEQLRDWCHNNALMRVAYHACCGRHGWVRGDSRSG